MYVHISYLVDTIIIIYRRDSTSFHYPYVSDKAQEHFLVLELFVRDRLASSRLAHKLEPTRSQQMIQP